MKKINPRFWGALWFLLLLVFLSAMITASFYLTAAVYQVAKISLAPLAVQIINTLLGLLFSSFSVGIVSQFAKARGWVPEVNLFGPIIDALEKIAKGDFSIRLASAPRDNQMVNALANSVNKMALELEQMENMRQEFISNVSHEIQSPLTSIRGFAQALQNETLDIEERHHYLEIIETESKRLSRITEDLLKLAALESEHAKFEPKAYRLDKQIRSLILACEPQWAEKALELTVSLEEIEITADEDLMSQVWMNLLHNSIKFTPQGGHIGVILCQESHEIICKIRDNGIGISPEDQRRIFERFYKADPARTRTQRGSGLGLAIVKKIIEMHQGEIKVESSPGVGTAFTVILGAEAV